MKLNEVFPYWLHAGSGNISGGFFSNLFLWADANEVDIPFIADSDTAFQLDIAYHGNYSGEKTISPLIENLIYPDGKLTTETVGMLVSMFWALHGVNCEKQYNVLSLEYNPIQNYDMTESGTDSRSGYDDLKHTGADTIRNSGTDTIRNTGTDTIRNSGTDSTLHSGSDTDSVINGTDTTATMAFDSGSFADVDKRTENRTDTHGYNSTEATTHGLQTATEHGLQTATEHGHTQTQEKNTTDKTEYHSSTGHSLSRSGNIGVTTSQQMIQSEIELWQWNFYHNYLFPVVDMVCTIPIY